MIFIMVYVFGSEEDILEIIKIAKFETGFNVCCDFICIIQQWQRQ